VKPVVSNTCIDAKTTIAITSSRCVAAPEAALQRYPYPTTVARNGVY